MNEFIGFNCRPDCPRDVVINAAKPRFFSLDALFITAQKHPHFEHYFRKTSRLSAALQGHAY